MVAGDIGKINIDVALKNLFIYLRGPAFPRSIFKSALASRLGQCVATPRKSTTGSPMEDPVETPAQPDI